MTRPTHPRDWRLGLLAFAALAACGTAGAQTSTAEASVSVGVGGIDGDRSDRALFGQYNGLRTKNAVGLLDFEYDRRYEATGASIRLGGVNLFGQTRELDLRWIQPGDWKFSAAYGESVRHDPLSANSGADLKVTRTRLGLGLTKTINRQFKFDVTLSSENKEGARLFGIGMNCPSSLAPTCGPTTGTETGWALLMLPEPIDANHSQIEARLSYAGDKLRLNGGYYGSFYRNAYGSLNPNVPASLNNPLGAPLPLSAGLQTILSQPLALPPDNQAHQFDVGGTYSFTPTTHGNFKLSWGRATQHQDFAAAGLSGAPVGVADLGGRLDTTRAQLGLSARPLPKLSLLAKLNYDERDDRTPVALYNIVGTTTYTNRLLPNTRWRGQLQANYQFTSDVRGTLAADYEAIDRGVFTATSAVAGLSALRQKTDETGVRAELRRRMNENLSAAISLASSRRDGSNWLRNNSGLGVTEVPDPNDPATGFDRAIFMPTLADRQRDTVRLRADWQPTDELALQFSAQSGRDRYTTPSAYGLRDTGTDQVSIDASYVMSSRWSFTGHVTYGNETLRQARPDGVRMDFDNQSTGLGIGVVGKPIAKVEVGANLSYVDDTSVYAQTLDATVDGASVALLAATGGLPDIEYRQTLLKLYGRYLIDKRSEVRLDVVHQRSTWTDWAWLYNGVPFKYSDGTLVGQEPRQSVTFVGLRYVYRWP